MGVRETLRASLPTSGSSRATSSASAARSSDTWSFPARVSSHE